jgi:hypothetical protein
MKAVCGARWLKDVHRALEKQGEDSAAALLRMVGEQGEVARDLA